jgi:hypothetical protein
VWIWEKTAIISLYSINWLVFITETECVYWAVRSAHTVYLCVLCGSENKQRLFHYTALTGWFLKCQITKIYFNFFHLFNISLHTHYVSKVSTFFLMYSVKCLTAKKFYVTSETKSVYCSVRTESVNIIRLFWLRNGRQSKTWTMLAISGYTRTAIWSTGLHY